MKRSFAWSVCVLLCLSASPARAKEPKPEPPPFRLTAEEEKSVDRALERWEQWNAGVKTFQCGFKRWTYDVVFADPSKPLQPKFIELGTITFAAPDRCRFRVHAMEVGDTERPIEDSRAEHWFFNGESIWEYARSKKMVIEHRLPPELQGTRLVDGPLAFAFPATAIASLFHSGSSLPATPFPFAAHAKEIKQRYYIREVTPAGRADEIWLEAFPRSAELDCLCHRMVLIFRASDMRPYALRIVAPNGKDYTVYQFYDFVLNAYDATVNGKPLSGDEELRPIVPKGWQLIPDSTPPAAGLLLTPPRRPLAR
jgi:TIGR03009 family protein